METGKSLKEARAKNKMTQKQVSLCIGISLPRYQSYEEGRAVPPLPIAYKIAQLYQTTIEDLFISNELKINEMDKDRELFNKYSSLSERDKAIVDAVLG